MKNKDIKKEIQERIVSMLQNRVGDIEYYFHPDDGIPEWLKPYGDIFIFKKSKLIKKGEGYFLDTGKIGFKYDKKLQS